MRDRSPYPSRSFAHRHERRTGGCGIAIGRPPRRPVDGARASRHRCSSTSGVRAGPGRLEDTTASQRARTSTRIEPCATRARVLDRRGVDHRLDVGIQPRRTTRPPSPQEVVGGLELSLDLLEASALLGGGLPARLLVEQRVFLLGELLDVLDEVLVVLHRGKPMPVRGGRLLHPGCRGDLPCVRTARDEPVRDHRRDQQHEAGHHERDAEAAHPGVAKGGDDRSCCSGERPASCEGDSVPCPAVASIADCVVGGRPSPLSAGRTRR